MGLERKLPQLQSAQQFERVTWAFPKRFRSCLVLASQMRMLAIYLCGCLRLERFGTNWSNSNSGFGVGSER